MKKIVMVVTVWGLGMELCWGQSGNDLERFLSATVEEVVVSKVEETEARGGDVGCLNTRTGWPKKSAEHNRTNESGIW